MSTILVTGANGQVGHELARLLEPLGGVIAATHGELDLANPDAIAKALRGAKPKLVVNAGAYTNVDRAEKETDLAYAINGRAPGVLADEAKRLGAVLIHFSTDYVFDGKRETPYSEDAATAPLQHYGKTKLEGEHAIAEVGGHALVFRTSWVYGLRGSNFLLTIRRLAAQRKELPIVADQFGVPNWSRVLAESIERIVRMGLGDLAERAGVYHLSSTGQTSWHGFAQTIVGNVPTPTVVPITTEQYVASRQPETIAPRPVYGVLDTTRFQRAFGFALPDWREAFARCVASESEAQSARRET